jgi:hypothetical protein
LRTPCSGGGLFHELERNAKRNQIEDFGHRHRESEGAESVVIKEATALWWRFSIPSSVGCQPHPDDAS